MSDKDINQLLTCFDPRQERLLKATFRIVEKATGFPFHDLFVAVDFLCLQGRRAVQPGAD